MVWWRVAPCAWPAGQGGTGETRRTVGEGADGCQGFGHRTEGCAVVGGGLLPAFAPTPARTCGHCSVGVAQHAAAVR
eukprot:gene5645-biopygen2757